MKKISKIGMVVLCVAALASFAMSETKYKSTVTGAGAEITWGVDGSSRNLTMISGQSGGTAAESSGDSATLKVWVRTGTPGVVTGFATTNCQVSTTGTLATADTVMYCHANGTAEYTTIATMSATNVYLYITPSPAYAAGDKIVEVAQVWQADVGITNRAGIASVVYTGDPLVVVPADSPIRIVCDGVTNDIAGATLK